MSLHTAKYIQKFCPATVIRRLVNFIRTGTICNVPNPVCLSASLLLLHSEPTSTLTSNVDAVNGSHIGHLPRCTAIKLLSQPAPEWPSSADLQPHRRQGRRGEGDSGGWWAYSNVTDLWRWSRRCYGPPPPLLLFSPSELKVTPLSLRDQADVRNSNSWGNSELRLRTGIQCSW